ncbi:hypothetical protein ACQKWADRAFT_284754 [Trichoderma austrokoningii]
MPFPHSNHGSKSLARRCTIRRAAWWWWWWWWWCYVASSPCFASLQLESISLHASNPVLTEAGAGAAGISVDRDDHEIINPSKETTEAASPFLISCLPKSVDRRPDMAGEKKRFLESCQKTGSAGRWDI